jgi:MinD-like ATPase involved in chromosome partitioning or flagellar assembly
VKAKKRNGRIATFYSYKGGTGRSMAVANVGWILASAGKRVLLIDWDLEAPGLHRYFHPFLEDKELVATRGLIDFFVAFATAARDEGESRKNDWFEPFASLLPYTIQLQWSFPGEGTLELVPAGKQDAAYAVRATSFDWQHFYEHGGGIFLEAVKRNLRADYDYVLIDSRTGISDTSGMCTVQMPDDLVVLFTLNGQSIKGASAIADSADRQRRTSDGRPSLKIWPVPTRVELAEKERLEAARDAAKATFDRFLGHLRRSERAEYWNDVQVMYQPYYAYEEVLAHFGDSRKTTGSMLAAMERIASLVTYPATVSVPYIQESLRRKTLALFDRVNPGFRAVAEVAQAGGLVYISYSWRDQATVTAIADRLASTGLDVWIDTRNLRVGDDIARAHSEALERCSIMLYFVGSAPPEPSEWREHELMSGLAMNKVIVPVRIDGAVWPNVPSELRTRQAATLDGVEDAETLAEELKVVLQSRASVRSIPIDPEDPQKGRWGGQSERSGRELIATVRELADEWFEVTLDCHQTPKGGPLLGDVQFHLHPTFGKPVQVVEAHDGHATLTITCWGAFTVGVVADGGRTMLELDLAADESFPQAFREH